MFLTLLSARRFAPLFWCQFFSAFSDNFVKNALVFLILFRASGDQGEALITLAAAVFIAPFFFLSGLGGEMADRFDKSLVAQRLKLAEIGVAVIAIVGFVWQDVTILFVALGLFGVIGALFGPIKYGILPDHLQRTELPAGNALIEGATFLAILLGTIAGGLASGGGDALLLSMLMLVFAAACWSASLWIPPTGEAAPDVRVRWNIAASTAALVRHLYSDRKLWWGALVVSWFWLVGIVVLALMPPLVKRVLGADQSVVTACLTLFSVAIGLGSLLAAQVARGRIILLPTLAGAVVMGFFALDLGWATTGMPAATQSNDAMILVSSMLGVRITIDLAGLAIGGGLYVVPAFAAVQAWAGPDYRARVVAAVNVLNAAFMAAGTVAIALLQLAGLSTSVLFLLLGAAGLLVAFAIARTLPT